MGTVQRVLPWRRHTPAPAEELAPLLAATVSVIRGRPWRW